MVSRSFGIALLAGAAAGLASSPAVAQMTERQSVDSAGVEGNDFCDWPDVSADGRFVTFSSSASNLVPSDLNGEQQGRIRP